MILKTLIWACYIESQEADLFFVRCFRLNPYSVLHILYGVFWRKISLH